MSGAAESEPKIPDEKQLIHYKSASAAEARAIERPPAASEYLCDMFNEKFSDPSELQEQRVLRHRAPTGI